MKKDDSEKGITLIGMPGSGKSTIGKKLAHALGWNFIDLDILINKKEGKSHSLIMEERGESGLMRLEENYTLPLNLERTVFSPGGSIVYSKKAMEKLSAETRIIYLDLPLKEIKRRLGAGAASRGIIGLEEKGLGGLFNERQALYQKTAHQKIMCLGLGAQAIISKIIKRL